MNKGINMYFITLNEGGKFKSVYEDGLPEDIIKKLYKKFDTFICWFADGRVYDTIIKKYGLSPWRNDSDMGIEEFNKFKESL